MLTTLQKEHSASILEAPKAYGQQSPPKPKNIITLDCRGLEFVDFKPDVSACANRKEKAEKLSLTVTRERGKPLVLSLGRSSLTST